MRMAVIACFAALVSAPAHASPLDDQYRACLHPESRVQVKDDRIPKHPQWTWRWAPGAEACEGISQRWKAEKATQQRPENALARTPQEREERPRRDMSIIHGVKPQ